MRIALAIVILADLIIRGGDLTAHYTNEGILPADIMHNFGWKPGFWTFHELSGSYIWVLSLFILHFIFALFLLFGYKTKFSTLIVWLLYISLHNRNLYIQQAGDDLIRLVLFWGLFLPWNTYYSFDVRKIITPAGQKPLANFGYLLLISSVYFFTVSLKYGDEWRNEHSAIYYALSLDQLRLPVFGDWLYQFPALMKVLSIFVYYTELIIPFFILFPAKKGYLRLIAFLLIIILHSGIGLTLYVGLFFIINIVCAIALLPGFVIDKLEKRFSFLNSAVQGRVRSVNPGLKRKIKWLVNPVCILVIFLSLIINLSAVKWFRYQLRDEMIIPINALRFDQYWGMFSPSVLKRDGWYVYYALDSIGKPWDLVNNTGKINYDKPESVIKMHKTDRWRKLTENMQRDDITFLRPLFCKYVLREWNKKHPEKKMNTLFLYYMQKESLPDYKTTPVQKILFSTCNDN